VVALVEPEVKKGKPAKEPKVAEEKPEKEPKVAEEKPEKEPKVAEEKPEKEPKVADDKPEKTPKKTVSTANGEIKRKRPKEQIPLIIGGSLAMVAGGGMYAMAGQRRGDFDASNDLIEVDRLQGQINRLVIASAAVTAVGAGTLTWGVILDGGSVMPTVQFRF
jgi:hypothetical protein